MTIALEPAPHEYAANYVYNHAGLSPWFAAASQTDATGARHGTTHVAGHEWAVTLSYQESGLAPPDGGHTPDGTPVEFDTLREYRLNLTATDDDVGERKARFLIQPRWRGLQSQDGDDVARPLWNLGDAVNVRVRGSNVRFHNYSKLLEAAAAAVGINPDHFDADELRPESVVTDAAMYVRVLESESGPIHARAGPLARMGHLLENDRSGYRKLVQDDTERAGYYHTATLGPSRIREAFPDHALPKELKHYYARNPDSLPKDHPLAHPKLEASYQGNRWDNSVRPRDLDQLTTELEEAVLSTLEEAGLPTRPGVGGQTFKTDAYFSAEESDRDVAILPLDLDQIEHDQRNVVIRHLQDGLSPVEWESLDFLVADGGEASPDAIAEEYDRHPDSVRRALRRIDDLVDRSYGEVSLRSHHVAEMVHEAVQDAQEAVGNAVEAGAKAMDMAEREMGEATEELIAYCNRHGIHVDEREARLRIKMGDMAGKDWKEVMKDLLALWRRAGRDVDRLRDAQTEYRDEVAPKIRPAAAAIGAAGTIDTGAAMETRRLKYTRKER